MKPKDTIKLDALSLLDEEILDKNTEKRWILFRKCVAKRAGRIWTSALSSLAAVALLVSVVSILLYRRTLPVYRGMTVSGSAPSSAQTVYEESRTVGYLSRGATLPAVADNTETQPEQTETEQTEAEDALSFATDDYYAQPGQDVFITVHIDNPSGYEILSFTLNGVKYSSYMFEPGSDLENLILKVNVGTETGVREFTIDQIKYVKGEKIRNVLMDGEDTVRVTVTPYKLVETDGMAMRIRYDQMQTYLGIDAFDSLALYDNGVKLYDIAEGQEQIVGLPFDRAFELVGSYTKDGERKTFSYPFLSPESSKGLLISLGKIEGIGTCTDTVLYLNLPIADGAFDGCDPIETVYMGEGVTSIGYRAFANCTALETVILPEGVTSIGYSAFENCTALETVILPRQLDKIVEGAFSHCSSLVSLTLPDGITSIGGDAFSYCTSLESLILPEGVTYIGQFSFQCINGLDISLPSTVEKIGWGSFSDCDGLTIRYNGTVAEWNAIEKEEAWYTYNSVSGTIYGKVICTDGEIPLSATY